MTSVVGTPLGCFRPGDYRFGHGRGPKGRPTVAQASGLGSKRGSVFGTLSPERADHRRWMERLGSLCQLYLHLIFGCPPLQGSVLPGGRSPWALPRAVLVSSALRASQMSKLQGTTSVVPGAAVAPVGFSRCEGVKNSAGADL
jgi:hypothetical protein